MPLSAPALLGAIGMNENDAIPTLSAPSAALLLTALGSGVILGARSARPRLSPVALLAGLAFVGFAAHRPLVQVIKKAGRQRRSADVRVSFVVERPVEQVFAYCSNFENYPQFIRSLLSVRDNGDGRSHWCAATPSGGTIEWNAVTTKFVTNSVIGWKSDAQSPVEMNGLLRFSNEGGTTCVRVAISYRFPEGSLRDAVAALTSRSTTSELEHDIALIEAHIPRGDLEESVVAAVT